MTWPNEARNDKAAVDAVWNSALLFWQIGTKF